ncbi:O-antigen ligase family protein [Natrononativus amylolyticus]|uniref:O-antigen ligase family protein n=1 Tax=Natrononativus amylolyticus TaxID=2963434 RepID=UPI0020CBB3D5|nr:O-antigen ligase family protein [Natrononativus amylolyticus]
MSTSTPDTLRRSRQLFSLELALVLLLCYNIYISARYFGGVLEGLPINYLLLAAIAVGAAGSLVRSPPRAEQLVAIGLFALFVLFYAVSVLWSSGGSYTQWKLLRVVVVIPILFVGSVALFSGSPRRTHRFFVLFGIAAVVLSTEVLYSRLLLDRAAHWQLNVNYILISRVLGVGVLVFTYLCFQASERWRQLLYGFLSLFSFGAMLQTGGRGPLIALLGALFVYGGWLALRSDWTISPKQLVASVAVGAVGAGSAAWVFRDSRTIERLTSLLTWSEEQSASSRVDYFVSSIQYWADRPILGHGLGEFPLLYYGEDIRYYPHNVVLEIAVEAGIVGTALFLGLVGYVVAVSLSAETDRPLLHGLAVSFFVYVFANAMVTGDLSTNRILFVSLPVLLFVVDAPDPSVDRERDASVTDGDEDRARTPTPSTGR